MVGLGSKPIDRAKEWQLQICSLPSHIFRLLRIMQSSLTRLGMATRYSEAAIFRGVVYLAGQVPEETVGAGIEAQTTEVLGMIDRLLDQSSSDKSRILMCQIFIADLADFDGMNRVWDQWVSAGHAPPRATVEAKLANPQYRLEIVVTAAQFES